VREAIRDLGYVPNPAARSLRSHRTRTLGLIVPDLLSPMTVALVRGIEDAAGAAGYALLVADSRLDPRIEEAHISDFLDRRVDGLLCSPLQSIAAIERGTQRPDGLTTPIVLLQLRRPRREFVTAFVDEGQAIEHCSDHLVSLGHQRIAMVHSASRAAGGRHRRDLLRAALQCRGISGGAELDRVFTDGTECYRQVSELLVLPDGPTAMLVGIHQFVPPTLQAIRDARLRIPEDVSLVVFGDSDWARASSPPLSTIVVDQQEHAAGAVRLLLELIAGRHEAPRSFRSESVYVARGSVGAAREGRS
jgi:LacI family transcriptional regulator